MIYTKNRLEWHLDVDGNRRTLQIPVRSCQTTNELLISVIRFVVALAKSQDRREICRVFAFGQHNAVRRWLCLRYPITRANQSGERGRIFRAWRLKQSEDMRCDDLAPKSRHLKHRANFVYEHGKAMLCSNLHQKALLNTRGKR
jgi:hypothetical protein